MQVQPYLFFEGRCEEAAKFYEGALRAKIEALMRFKDSPDPGMCPPSDGNKIMHMSLRIGDQTIIGFRWSMRRRADLSGIRPVTERDRHIGGRSPVWGIVRRWASANAPYRDILFTTGRNGR